MLHPLVVEIASNGLVKKCFVRCAKVNPSTLLTVVSQAQSLAHTHALPCLLLLLYHVDTCLRFLFWKLLSSFGSLRRARRRRVGVAGCCILFGSNLFGESGDVFRSKWYGSGRTPNHDGWWKGSGFISRCCIVLICAIDDDDVRIYYWLNCAKLPMGGFLRPPRISKGKRL